jgi:hypothetical protein
MNQREFKDFGHRTADDNGGVNSETLRGRAQLNDLSAARGVYEVDYIIRISTRTIKAVGMSLKMHRTVSTDIRPVSGGVLKNGPYNLEEDGKILYALEKKGAIWYVA